MVRQPGSAFKPFVYVTAFENKFESSDLLSNEKKTYAGGWTPKNYEDESGGKVTLEQALIDSMNIPTIDLANRVGMSKILKTAQDAGISTLVMSGKQNDDNLAAAIGGLTNGVSVYDMAEAYSVFANDGKLIKPIAVLKVVDRNGSVLEDHTGTPESTQVINENAVYKLTCILQKSFPEAPAETHTSAARQQARQAPPTVNTTHGSSATPRSSSQPSGSATTPPATQATPAAPSRQPSGETT